MTFMLACSVEEQAQLVLKQTISCKSTGFRLISTNQGHPDLALADVVGALSLAGPDSLVFTVSKPAGSQGAAGCTGADANTHS